MTKSTILYLGNYLSRDIVIERQLPTSNPAGSNRTIRIAEALSLNYDVIIISPAITFRNKLNFKKLFLKKRTIKINSIDVVFAKTIAIPLIGLIFSHFSYSIEILKNIKSRKVKNVVIYNFGSLNLFVLLIIKLFYPRISILNNIEDISVFKFKDFSFSSEDNFLQQAFFSVSMRITAYLSNGYIIPTQRFLNYLPKNNSYLIINGCMNVNKNTIIENVDVVKILFSGKIAFEHGIKEFVEFIQLYKSKIISQNIKIDITGTGPKSKWLIGKLNEIGISTVKYHGFVNNEVYAEYLKEATICVALQKPDGRHANFKTPSKVYEYLGNSKIVIATNVGDFYKINNRFINICEPLNAEALMVMIDGILINKQSISKLSHEVYQFAFDNYDMSNVSKKLHEFIENAKIATS